MLQSGFYIILQNWFSSSCFISGMCLSLLQDLPITYQLMGWVQFVWSVCSCNRHLVCLSCDQHRGRHMRSITIHTGANEGSLEVQEPLVNRWDPVTDLSMSLGGAKCLIIHWEEYADKFRGTDLDWDGQTELEKKRYDMVKSLWSRRKWKRHTLPQRGQLWEF